MSRTLVARSDDPRVTKELAEALAPLLAPGDVLCLDGELGAGKTAFVAAVSHSLGVQQEVVSPTFTLENRYAAGDEGIRTVAHYDLYRPGADALRDLVPMMLEARDEGCLVAVEWPEPAREWLEPYLWISIALEENSDVRRIRLRDVPEGWPRWDQLAAAWSAIDGRVGGEA